MKGIIKKTAFNAFALFLLTQFLSGVTIQGGLGSFIFGGFVLTILIMFIEPILNLVSLPLTFVTMGLFSFLTHALLFYILALLMPTINVNAFTFDGATLAGFVVPKIYFNTFFAYVAAAVVHSVIMSALSWITKD